MSISKYSNPQQDEPSLMREPVTSFTIDTKAREESRDIVSKARRNRREQNAKHWSFVFLVWIVIGCVAIAFVLKVWHLLAPPYYCWLDEAHLTKINEFLTTGILSGGAGVYFRSKYADTPE